MVRSTGVTLPSTALLVHIVALAALFVVQPVRVDAFDTPGHDVIEAAAYKYLLAMPRGAIATLPNESGKSILDTLIACGMLHRPQGYGRSDVEFGLRDKLPRVGSGDPDLIFTRQFSANGQQFHFMATPEDVYNSPDVDLDPPPPFPRYLLERAYPRCIRFLSGMTAELLWGDRREAADAERGVYAVLHSIVDSYSNAHVARSADLRQVLYVKGWDVTGAVVNIVHPSGWSWMGPDAQHRFFEPDDADYLRADTMIVEVDGDTVRPVDLRADPYSIPESCLTPRSLAARQAVVDYLVSLVRMMRASDRSEATMIWQEYLGNYFGSPTMPEVTRQAQLQPQPEEEREPNHTMTYGGSLFIGPGMTVIGGELSASLQLPMMMAAPMHVTAQAHVGYRDANSRSTDLDDQYLFLDIEPFTNYQISLLDNLMLDWSVFVVRVNAGEEEDSRGTWDLFTRVPRLQVLVYNRPSIALTLSGPTINIFSGRNSGYFGVGVNVSNLSAWRMSEGNTVAFDRPIGQGWEASDDMDTLDGGRTTTLRLVTGGFERGAKIYPDRVWTALEVMWDRDEHTRRSGLGTGLQFGLGWTPNADFDNSGLGLFVAPVVRYRHHSSALALAAVPLQTTIQWGGPSISDHRAGKDGGRGTPNLWWYGSIQGSATWGRIELAVDLLRWGYGDFLGDWTAREIELLRWGFAGFQLSVLL